MHLGTATANFAPAVIEAHEARVPMLVLTADRPPELREVGAGQTIDQLKLYGSGAKWFFDIDDHPATPSACAGCGCSPAGPSGRRWPVARAWCT
jgi:2-succinyl-5-enolpyruvyl-6-hydroxy-3-cyclohexene-1-carboxylate synthase